MADFNMRLLTAEDYYLSCSHEDATAEDFVAHLGDPAPLQEDLGAVFEAGTAEDNVAHLGDPVPLQQDMQATQEDKANEDFENVSLQTIT